MFDQFNNYNGVKLHRHLVKHMELPGQWWVDTKMQLYLPYHSNAHDYDCICHLMPMVENIVVFVMRRDLIMVHRLNLIPSN